MIGSPSLSEIMLWGVLRGKVSVMFGQIIGLPTITTTTVTTSDTSIYDVNKWITRTNEKIETSTPQITSSERSTNQITPGEISTPQSIHGEISTPSQNRSPQLTHGEISTPSEKSTPQLTSKYDLINPTTQFKISDEYTTDVPEIEIDTPKPSIGKAQFQLKECNDVRLWILIGLCTIFGLLSIIFLPLTLLKYCIYKRKCQRLRFIITNSDHPSIPTHDLVETSI
jgi:hypothetical protein